MQTVIIIDLGTKKNNHLGRTVYPKTCDSGCLLSVSCAGFTLSADTEILEALTALADYTDAQICRHEDTHRGGAIWEICDACGARWSDDRNPKPDHVKLPHALENALRVIEQHKATATHGSAS